jgi:myosin-5
MQFSETGRLLGTAIETYLLEKVRVVHQSEGERNYHIFYELLSSSVSEEESVRLQTRKRKPSDFKLLSSGTYVRRDGVQDSDTYQDLRKAMKMIGFSSEEISDIMTVTAAVMHASNTIFDPKNDEGCSVARDNVHLTATCQLLGIQIDDFEEALCFFSRMAGGQVYRSPQSVERAEKGLDALLKATYGALFEFLVKRINISICGHETGHSSVIGVLDIFGFESFTTNSFEQLCINYCNEVLQQQFNTFMLKNEQAEYISEGIDWDFIKFPENQDVLDLIEHKTDGIMSILDDMCKAPGASDKAFVSEIIKRCDKQSCFTANFKDTSPLFSVKHFAGSVEYTTDGFLEKNRNELPKETSELLKSSSSKFVHKLADIIVESSSNGNAEASKTRTVKTVGGFFRQQVKDLRQKIDATYPHYVRCVKPNSALVHSEFDSAMVAQQLRCGGILQAVSVTRDGFTLHYSHEDFLQRYQVLVDEKAGKVTVSKHAIETECKKLVDTLLARIEEEEQYHSNKESTDDLATEESAVDRTDVSEDNEVLIQFGKTKVLLKHHAFLSLERLLGAIQNRNATILNTAFRRHFCQTAYRCVRAAFRAELASRGTNFEEWFEHREIYYRPREKGSIRIPNLVSHRMKMFNAAAGGNIKKKRKEVADDSKKIELKNQVWILQDDGLFTRNPDYVGEPIEGEQ